MNQLPCVAPDELQEGDLAASLEGQASPQVMAHLEHCPACRAEAEALRHLMAQLSVHAYRASCPDGETLLHYQAGLLTEEKRAPVARHLRDCVHCQSEMAELVGAQLPTPGISWVEWFREQGRRLLVALPSLTVAPPGWATRGERSQPTTRYQAEAYQLLVRVAPAPADPARLAIEGWVTSRLADHDPAPSTVQLLNDGVVVASTGVDDMGYFVLEAIPAGIYTLQLELTSLLVIVPTLEAKLDG